MIRNLSSGQAHALVNDLKSHNVDAKVSEHRTNGILHIQVNVFDDWHKKPFSIGSLPPRSRAIASRLKEISARDEREEIA